MHFFIEVSSTEPVFQQLIRQIKEKIAMGELRPGEKIPAVREMAMQCMINPNTVQKAYRELRNEGVIFSRKGLGMFVSEKSQPLLAEEERLSRIHEALDSLITNAIHLGFSKQEIVQELKTRLERFQGGEE